MTLAQTFIKTNTQTIIIRKSTAHEMQTIGKRYKRKIIEKCVNENSRTKIMRIGEF